MAVVGGAGLLTFATLALAAIAAVILLAFLIWRPALHRGTKLWLLLGVGILPIGTALTGNIAGFETTMQRQFCASCHPMHPYTRDAADSTSTKLAAFHSRNQMFGTESCYTCHKDYRLFGTVTTKLTGLRHLWAYYTKYTGDHPPASPIHLYKPYPNTNCTQCHSMTLPGFRDEPEHAAVEADLKKGAISCASEGCHGPVHPKVAIK